MVLVVIVGVRGMSNIFAYSWQINRHDKETCKTSNSANVDKREYRDHYRRIISDNMVTSDKHGYKGAVRPRAQ